MFARACLTALTVLLILAPHADAQGRRRRPDRAPKVGAQAPDFHLRFLDHGKPAKKRAKLSDFRRSKPVVLVFGSYT